MIELKKHYENTKRNATLFMKKGQINAYVNALLEMNRYKKLISAVAAN
jgi:hypothetical protein